MVGIGHVSAAEFGSDAVNTIALCGRIDTGDSAKMLTALSGLNRSKVKNNGLHIVINSPGGSASVLMSLINVVDDYRDQVGCKIITRLYGDAASAGAILFLMGDERIISEFSEIMFHDAAYYNPLTGEKIDENNLTTGMKYSIDKLNKWMRKQLKKKTRLPKRFIDDEVFIEGPVALKYNVATKLKTNFF